MSWGNVAPDVEARDRLWTIGQFPESIPDRYHQTYVRSREVDDPDLKQAVEARAEADHTTASEIIRQALRRFL